MKRNGSTICRDRVRERLAEPSGRPRDEDDLACERFQLSDFARLLPWKRRSVSDQGSVSTTFAVAVPPLPSLIVYVNDVRLNSAGFV